MRADVVRAKARSLIARVTPFSGELAVALGVLTGWSLATLAIARAVRPDIVWPLSAGVFLLLLCGIRFLGQMFWKGLFLLTKGEG